MFLPKNARVALVGLLEYTIVSQRAVRFIVGDGASRVLCGIASDGGGRGICHVNDTTLRAPINNTPTAL